MSYDTFARKWTRAQQARDVVVLAALLGLPKPTQYEAHNPASHPPRDGTWISVSMIGKADRRRVQFDPAWGKSGGWFDDQGQAVSEANFGFWAVAR